MYTRKDIGRSMPCNYGGLISPIHPMNTESRTGILFRGLLIGSAASFKAAVPKMLAVASGSTSVVPAPSRLRPRIGGVSGRGV